MMNLFSKELLTQKKRKKVVSSATLVFSDNGSGWIVSGEKKSYSFKKGTFYRFILISASAKMACYLTDSKGYITDPCQIVFGEMHDANGALIRYATPGEVGPVLGDDYIVSPTNMPLGFIGEFQAAENYVYIQQSAVLGHSSSMTLQVDELV